MAGKTSSKTGNTTRKGSTTRASTPRKSTRKRSTKKQHTVTLRPEHQRELFALALITIALCTFIFALTGTMGGIGDVYIQFLQSAFGSGALIVPFTLGILGVAILVQERLRDSPYTDAQLLGTFLVTGMLLAMLEFPAHHVAMAYRMGEGGGAVGYTIVYLLVHAIGRPAAMLVVFMVMVAGFLLMFNVTLHSVVVQLASAAYWVRTLIWGEPPPHDDQPGKAVSADQQKSGRAARRAAKGTGADDEQDNGTLLDDMVHTPIAIRPTRASLFKRPEAQSAQGQGAAAKQEHPPKGNAVAGKAAAPTTTPPPTPPPGAEQAPALVEQHPIPLQSESDQPAIHHAWPLPAIEMLDMPLESSMSDEEKDRERSLIARLIEETLASFKVEAQVVGCNPGPAVTQFELQPAVGVKISKITTLEKDLALALAAPSIRIQAPIPGKAVIGVEIPNSVISLVTLREVIDSEEAHRSRGRLKLPLGKDVSGTSVIADMTRMPHLLVAGSTGSGKSVSVNAFLCGLLLRHTPEELRIILVDPKMVELVVYNRVPHLLSPVVTEVERVVPTLKWATREMERRYKIFARHGCRNLESYRDLRQHRADLEPMPYILIVIDELADLMMVAPDEVETQICRLAQMARATGIHLIIATQRPSVDVITGLIKANFPSRIAFAVTSQTDSRVILDTPGAEQLLGRGDMLYMAADAAKLVRIQGTYVSDREVEKIVNFWRNATPPQPDAAAAQAKKGSTSSVSDGDDVLAHHPPTPASFLSDDEQDHLLPQARDLVQKHKRASASLLTRRLHIGYSKAAQLIDLLEEQGVVGPAENGRSREVLTYNEEEE
jgi:S-DNA-T family DNA segregation ATPase FtsK/SpoIIIE